MLFLALDFLAQLLLDLPVLAQHRRGLGARLLAELAFELSSRALAGSPLLGVREGLADKLHLEGGGGGGDDDGSGSDDDNVGGVLSRRLP